MTAKQVTAKLAKIKDDLSQKHHVKALYLFGSLARGEGTRSSDVDILVDFSDNGVTLFDFLDLKVFLESVLQKKVDLVTRDALRPFMKESVERQAVRVA